MEEPKVATVQTPAEKLPDFAQTEAKHGIPKWVEVAWRKESERANYNAEAAADNLKALQECQKALAGALSDVVMLRAELSDAKYEIKDLKRGSMSWEDATCGDTEV
jgi:ribonuclease PH